MLNLAKCLIKIRTPLLDMSQARHGLSVKHGPGWAILGDQVSVKASTKFVNIFGQLMQALEGVSPTFGDVAVRELLPQIVPGHRLWTYACQKNEKFLAVDVECLVNGAKKRTWLRLRLDRGELHHILSSVRKLIKRTHLPGKWRHVREESGQEIVLLEQRKTLKYQHRPIDVIQDLFQQLRPVLWYTVTSSKPHRKYYLFAESHGAGRRLPQWAAMYILFYYLSDLTRYRPQLFDRFVANKYGPLIENALDECPRQFLYLMASELLRRDVAPAGIVV